MQQYNKLVRDAIPEIIRQTGKECNFTILNESKYVSELKKKSYEELEEYMNSHNDEEAIEELADLLEIIHALANTHGVSFKEVEEIRKRKASRRGGFSKRVFLVDVTE